MGAACGTGTKSGTRCREELEYALAESDSRALSQSWLERELLLALARGTNWLCGPDKLDQLLKLCVTDSGCSEVNALRRQWREQLELWVHPSGEGWGIRVGHYTLGSLAEGKRKLSLFRTEPSSSGSFRVSLPRKRKGFSAIYRAFSNGEPRNSTGKSHGLERGDALQAACSRVFGLRLWTLNRKHYPMDDIGFFP